MIKNPMYISFVPRLRRGEPGMFYHVHDVKSRHDLIMGGVDAHAQTFSSLLQPSFQVNIFLVCYFVFAVSDI